MIRHDIQYDLAIAHKALLLARELSNQAWVLDEINTAHNRVLDIAEKLGVDLTQFKDD